MNGLIALLVVVSVLGMVGLNGLIAMLIVGGIGFAIGGMAGQGWAVFGAILGGLMGISTIVSDRRSNHGQ